MKTSLAILALALLSSGSTAAQSQSNIPSESYWFKPLGTDEGLSQGDVFKIIQDSLGFIWIGTSDGLNRFDGYRIEMFFNDPADSLSIPDNWIDDISLGADGRMWVSTTFGVSLINTYSGQLVRNYPISNVPGFVRELKSGSVWAGSNTQISKIERETGTVTTFESIPGDPTSIPEGQLAVQHARTGHQDSYFFEDEYGNFWFVKGDTLVAYKGEEEGFVRYSAGRLATVMDADSTGRMWVGSADGLTSLDPMTRVTETIWRFDESVPDDERIVYSLHVDRRQWVWITTLERAYAIDTITGRQVQSFVVPTIPTPPPRPLYLEQETDTELWFIQYGGPIYRYRYEDDSFIEIIRDPKDRAENVVEPWDIFVDRSRTLWFAGTSGSGVMFADLEFNAFSSIGVSESELINPVTYRVTEDGAGGVWAMTHAGLERVDPLRAVSLNFPQWIPDNYGSIDGLFTDSRGDVWIAAPSTPEIGHWNASMSQMRTFRNGSANSPGLRPGQPKLFAEDPSGTIWIATQDDGMYFFDRATESFGALSSASLDSLSSSRIQTIEIDIDGDLWWSDQFGLYKRSRNTGEISEFRHFDSGEEFGAVKSLVADQLGNVWFTVLEKGLGRVAPDIGTAEHFVVEGMEGAFLSMEIASVDSNGDLWLGPSRMGNLELGPARVGTMRINPRTATSDLFTVQNSDLPMNSITSIVSGTNNDVWISTNGQGLARFDLETEELRVFTRAEGLPSKEFVAYATSLGPSGRLFLGGPQGITYFDPADFADNKRSPSIVLNGVRLFNEPIEPGPDSPLKRSASVANTLRLSHSQNDLSFDYVGLHYSDPSTVTYEYILDGYENEWRNVGTVQSATYPNLPFGRYTFRARAVTASGITSAQPIALSVVITAPWWRTWWAYGGYGVLLVLGLFGTYRIQTERTLRIERERTKDLELAQAEKLKVAHTELQDTHEELRETHSELQETHGKLKDSQEQLVHAEKMASLGQLTAGIAHEIKNPLNFVTNFAEVNAELAEELEEAIAGDDAEEVAALILDIKENTTQIAKHGTRADSIVKSMMQHASGADPAKELTEINSFVGQQADLAWHGRVARDEGFKAEFVRSLDENAGSAEVFPQELGRVLINLINNACDAVSGEEKPQITISTERSNGQVSITVADNGPGIPKDVQEKIFEPFFTTKPTGAGNTGLGLSISYDIVTEGHGGTIAVESEPGEGASFKITLSV